VVLVDEGLELLQPRADLAALFIEKVSHDKPSDSHPRVFSSMRSKITVIGDVLLTNRHAEIVRWPSPDSGGADVVVIADGNALAEAAEFVARRAPAAVVVATDPAWCEEL